jgi:hypothetical protein
VDGRMRLPHGEIHRRPVRGRPPSARARPPIGVVGGRGTNPSRSQPRPETGNKSPDGRPRTVLQAYSTTSQPVQAWVKKGIFLGKICQ